MKLLLPLLLVLLLSGCTCFAQLNNQSLSPKSVHITPPPTADVLVSRPVDHIFCLPPVHKVDAAEKTPLFIVNGNIVKEETFRTIAPTQVRKLRFLQGYRAVKKYGTPDLHGVIYISTKRFSHKQKRPVN